MENEILDAIGLGSTQLEPEPDVVAEPEPEVTIYDFGNLLNQYEPNT